MAAIVRDDGIFRVHDHQRSNDLGKVLIIEGETADHKLGKLEQESALQKRKIQELKKQNEFCFKLCLLISIISLIVGAILASYKLL